MNAISDALQRLVTASRRVAENATPGRISALRSVAVFDIEELQLALAQWDTASKELVEPARQSLSMGPGGKHGGR